MPKHVCIIGGGASGLYCAVLLKRLCPDTDITIIEKNPRVGKKLLATGNGKCNFTNYVQHNKHYTSDTPDMPYQIVTAHPPKEIVATFEQLGISAIEKDGLVYPRSAQASTVVDALRFSAEELGSIVRTQTEAKSIKYKNGKFMLDIGQPLEADAVVVATGSAASGGSASGLKLLRSFGHSIRPTYPALTGLLCETNNIRAAKGMRVRCTITLLQDNTPIASESGEVQFTDYGLSGICVMQLSRYVSKAQVLKSKASYSMRLDLAPETDLPNLIALYKNRRKTLSKRATCEFLSGFLNKQVGICVLKSSGIEHMEAPVSSLTDMQLEKIAQHTKNFIVAIHATRDESQAQACGGGVELGEFTYGLRSVLQNGLYACGEVLDVLGDCGGYNLTWAFASAYAVATDIAKTQET